MFKLDMVVWLQSTFSPTKLLQTEAKESVMADNRKAKVWEPFSKQMRFPDEDWAVLESVYNDYRFRQGDLQRAEFLKRMLAKGVTSYLVQLRSKTPDALFRIAEASKA